MYPVNAQLVSLWMQERQDQARERRLARLARSRTAVGAVASIRRLVGLRSPATATCTC